MTGEIRQPDPDEAKKGQSAQIVDDSSDKPEKPEINEDILSPEKGAKLESPERIIATKGALDKLIASADKYAHEFRRNIEEWHVDAQDGEPYEHWVRKEDPDLYTIYMTSFTDESQDDQYQLSLSYSKTEEKRPDTSKGLMLSFKSSVGVNAFTAANLHSKGTGASISGIRFHDFLYSEGAQVIPVHEHDYTVVHSLRAMGSDGFTYPHDLTYQATADQMDTILDLLAKAHVMQGEETGPSVSKLVPEIKDLTEA